MTKTGAGLFLVFVCFVLIGVPAWFAYKENQPRERGTCNEEGMYLDALGGCIYDSVCNRRKDYFDYAETNLWLLENCASERQTSESVEESIAANKKPRG